MEEVTINLIDLLHRILLRWRLILLWLLIGAILGEGIGYARAVSRHQEAEEALAHPEAAAAAYDLTEAEILEAEHAAEAYRNLQQNYAAALTYQQHSVKMQLDPNCVPTMTLQYAVDFQESEATFSTQDFLNALKVGIQGTDWTNATDVDIDPVYVQELIDMNTGDDWQFDEQGHMTGSVGAPDLLTIRVMAPDESTCQALAEDVQKVVVQASDQIKGTYGDCTLTLMQQSYTESADADLLSYQQEQLASLDMFSYSIKDLTANMSTDQEAYYEELIAGELAEEAASEEQTDRVIEAPKVLQMRFLILGAFLGVVLICAYLLLRYILAANLRIKDDLEEVYHLPILGTMEAPKKKAKAFGGVDRWMDAWFTHHGGKFSAEERLTMICAGISIAAKQADMQSLYVTGTGSDEESQTLMSQIVDRLSEQGCRITAGKSVVYDPASLEQMASADGVVLVERVDESPYLDLQKETELCQRYQVLVIGSVVIE